jgi:hypothetical protein
MAVLRSLVRQDCRNESIGVGRQQSQFLVRTVACPAGMVMMQWRHVSVTDLHLSTGALAP